MNHFTEISFAMLLIPATLCSEGARAQSAQENIVLRSCRLMRGG